eukprot:TRINITY_DN81158_c0_g1_i1.p1 TRINITY_DN81158_c0_g1~~TRINITY_DN81158_c0_g1_i1.p1  ORF type:complete len:322 (+),score=19.96 TRINITY_DN81158_c0_g1_i1:24-968(+)
MHAADPQPPQSLEELDQHLRWLDEKVRFWRERNESTATYTPSQPSRSPRYSPLRSPGRSPERRPPHAVAAPPELQRTTSPSRSPARNNSVTHNRRNSPRTPPRASPPRRNSYNASTNFSRSGAVVPTTDRARMEIQRLQRRNRQLEQQLQKGEQAFTEVLVQKARLENEVLQLRSRDWHRTGARKRPEPQPVTIAPQQVGAYPHAFIGAELVDGDGVQGVVVRSVVTNGPADRAGVRIGDHILQLAGVRVFSRRDAHDVLMSRQPGDQLTFVVATLEGRRRTGTLVLDGASAPPPRPPSPRRAFSPSKRPWRYP